MSCLLVLLLINIWFSFSLYYEKTAINIHILKFLWGAISSLFRKYLSRILDVTNNNYI